MKKLILKQVPEVEVQQWFLKMRREILEPHNETPLVVPKVTRQYTRKKKDVKTESASKFGALALSATLSDQKHSECKTDNSDKIKENDKINVDIKEEPNSLSYDKIKEENASEISNINIDIEQNCLYRKIYDNVRKENITECKIDNTDIIPDQNCVYINKMIDQVKIKEEYIEDEEVQCDLQDVNIGVIGVNNKLKTAAQHSIISDPVSLQGEAIRKTANTEICNKLASVKSSNRQNEELISTNVHKTFSRGISIYKKNESDITDGKSTSVNIKKEPADTKLVESMSNQSKQIKGNGQLRIVKLFCTRLHNPIGSSPLVIRKKINHSRPVALHPAKPLKVEMPSETYLCDACGEPFASKGAIRTHIIRSHCASARYACTVCRMRYRYYYELLAHLRAHRDKPLACDLCPKRFVCSKNYSTHMNTHLRERLHTCPVCLRRFARRDTLARHAARHSRADTFGCGAGACGAQFPSAAGLRRHREAAHGERAPHPCYVCTRALPSRAELLDHLRGHADADVECLFCSKRFTDLREWEEHSARHIAQTHDGTVPYVRKQHACDVCEMTFLYKSTLVTHLAVHTGRRPFKCSKCSRCYKTVSVLLEHERAHSRPFACETCGARFGKGNTLARHALRHTGERPHACTHCEASFIQRSSLLTHVQRQHMPTLKRARTKRKTKTGSKSKT